MRPPLLIVLALSAALGLSACANDPAVYTVKDVLANRQAHMKSPLFALEMLPLSVRDQVTATKVPANAVKPLALLVERVAVGGTAGTGAIGKLTFMPLSDGWTHVISEWSANDIPFRTNFALCYLGVDCVRQQSLLHNRQSAGELIEVTQIHRLTPGRHVPIRGQQYILDMQVRSRGFWASQDPPAQPERHVCTAGESYEAASLHPKLGGMATELACEIFVNDVLRSRVRYAQLLDYGIGVEVETSTTGWVARTVIRDVPGAVSPSSVAALSARKD